MHQGKVPDCCYSLYLERLAEEAAEAVVSPSVIVVVLMSAEICCRPVALPSVGEGLLVLVALLIHWDRQ